MALFLFFFFFLINSLAADVTSTEVTSCQLRNLCFLFQFPWGGESGFQCDKYRLTTSCYFLAAAQFQVPGGPGSPCNYRILSSWEPLQLKELVVIGQTLMLCPDKQVSSWKLAKGRVANSIFVWVTDSTALMRNLCSPLDSSDVTFILASKLHLDAYPSPYNTYHYKRRLRTGYGGICLQFQYSAWRQDYHETEANLDYTGSRKKTWGV